MNERILQVEGRSELRVAPDLAIVVGKLAVFSTGYREAQQAMNERLALLKGVAPGLGLSASDFKTSDFRVDRVTEELENRRKIQGYRATHEVRLEVPLEVERLNQIVSACASSGSQLQIDVEFGVKDHEVVRQRLLVDAVENAKRRADVLAQAAGVKLGPILSINYGSFDVRVTSDRHSYGEMLCEADDLSLDLNPTDLSASDKVTVTWILI